MLTSNHKTLGTFLGTVLFCCATAGFMAGCATGGGGGGGGGANNQAPNADAGDNQTVSTGSAVTLDGTGSSDPDGDTLEFSWTQTSGTDVALDDDDTDGPSFTSPAEAGTLTFELTVDDGNGGTDTDTVTVTVTADGDNQAPTADAGDNQTVAPGSNVTLDGSGSSDPDGDTLEFSWTQTSGTDVTLSDDSDAMPSFTAPAEDDALTFELTVSDGNGGTDTDTVTVTVTADGDNQDPTADAGDNQTVAVGSNVTLDGGGSTDPDGDTLQFSWSQTSGTNVALTNDDTASPSFTAPDAEDTLTFELTVIDGRGGADTDTVTVTVAEDVDNQAPTANAGDDQTVTGNSTVTLNGTDSSDPDGDALDFSWSQTSGTDVTLSDADSDSPSFTAPDEDGSLTFELTVDDGNGGSDTDSVTVTTTAAVVPQLYIANFNGNSVTSYANPSTVNGNIAPDTNLQGAQTVLDRPADIAVNAANQLLAVNFDTGTGSVTTYDDAPATNGNFEPDGNLQGAATQLVQPASLAVNTADDLLFVSDLNSDAIFVFANTSATLNGNLAPTRIIESTGFLNNPTGINFGADDELYVANNGDNNILVFANASALNGDVPPTRTIESAAFNAVFDVFIDQDDNMLVVNTGAPQILTFNDAAGLNANQTPDFTLDVNGATTLSAITVDVSGTGYLVDNAANAVYAYDNIANLNAALNPDRTIQGANTQLDAPIRVFLAE